MIAIATLAMAVAATCPSSYLDNEWNVPDRKLLCEGVDYHDCNIKLERMFISRHPKEVYRLDEDSLVFHVGNNEEFVLRNETQDRSRYEAYRYWGTKGDYHLIVIQFYEGVWFGLLNRESGRLTKVGGIPHVSPDGQWMASARLTQFGPYRQMVDIWRADEDGYVREKAEYFDIGGEELADRFGSALLRWPSDDSVQVCWAYSRGKKDIVTIGRFRFDGDEWLAEPMSNQE